MLEKWLEFLYPPCCGFCEKEQVSYLCEECFEKLKRKGLLLEEQKKERKTEYYDEIMWGYLYQKEIRNLIIAYKFKEKSYLHATFSELLIKNEKIYAFLKKYDTILTVPVERKKQAIRGFAPTYLIAKDLAKQCKLKLERHCIKKVKKTKPQSTLNRKERQTNLKDAFLLQAPEKLTGKKVILLDDVYTTGATIRECCKSLRKAKISRLGVLIIAKD